MHLRPIEMRGCRQQPVDRLGVGPGTALPQRLHLLRPHRVGREPLRDAPGRVRLARQLGAALRCARRASK